MYFAPDKARFKSYTKVLLEPVQVWRGEKSATKNIDQEDANYLSQYLYLRADEELRKDYAMVQQPGPGVMRIRIGITEALVGAASVEMEATDSQTGELLAAAVDRRGGGKYAWKSLNQWTDVEQSYTYWAKKMRWRACEMRGGARCEKPEE